MTNILIVGLGLMGGSFAKALIGYPDANIYGVDLNEETLKAAQNDGAIVKGAKTADEFLAISDVVIVCLTPEKAVDFINDSKFKSGALVTDICGVKGYVSSRINNPDIDYLGGHPMAGRECEGYENSISELYKNMNYLLIKNDNNTKEHITLMENLIKYIGCKKITYTTVEEHDKMIAYTSQLMHVVAAALCDNPILDCAEAFSAGSLRDCTRVAKLNPKMWAELFIENKAELSEQIKIFTESMRKIDELIKKEDRPGLIDFLTNTTERKMRYLLEQKN